MVEVQTMIEAILEYASGEAKDDKLAPSVTIAKIKKTGSYYAALVRWPSRKSKIVVAAMNGSSMRDAIAKLAEALSITFEDSDGEGHVDHEHEEGNWQP